VTDTIKRDSAKQSFDGIVPRTLRSTNTRSIQDLLDDVVSS